MGPARERTVLPLDGVARVLPPLVGQAVAGLVDVLEEPGALRGSHDPVEGRFHRGQQCDHVGIRHSLGRLGEQADPQGCRIDRAVVQRRQHDALARHRQCRRAQFVHDLARLLGRRRVVVRALQTREDAQRGCRDPRIQRQQQSRRPERVPSEQGEEPGCAGREELVLRRRGKGEAQRSEIVEGAVEPALQTRIGTRGHARALPGDRRGRPAHHEGGVRKECRPRHAHPAPGGAVQAPFQGDLAIVGGDRGIRRRQLDGGVAATDDDRAVGDRDFAFRPAGRARFHVLQGADIDAHAGTQSEGDRDGAVGVHGERLGDAALHHGALPLQTHLRIGRVVVHAPQQSIHPHGAGRDQVGGDVLRAMPRTVGAGIVHVETAHEPRVSVVDTVDRGRAHVAVTPRPRLGGCGERHDPVGQEWLQAGRHPFTAPSLVFMIFLWKRKKRTATGIVMIAAAASLRGYWVP